METKEIWGYCARCRHKRPMSNLTLRGLLGWLCGWCKDIT
jgi:hypothetical protein